MVSDIKAKKPLPTGLDTRAKLLKHQENTIRNHYSRVFRNENESLAKTGIHIKSSIGTTSRTKKKIGFKVSTQKITIKQKHSVPNDKKEEPVNEDTEQDTIQLPQ